MIEIEYIVKDRHGVERLRTADKKAADADDRVLENAERLAQLLRADSVAVSPGRGPGRVDHLSRAQRPECGAGVEGQGARTRSGADAITCGRQGGECRDNQGGRVIDSLT